MIAILTQIISVYITNENVFDKFPFCIVLSHCDINIDLTIDTSKENFRIFSLSVIIRAILNIFHQLIIRYRKSYILYISITNPPCILHLYKKCIKLYDGKYKKQNIKNKNCTRHSQFNMFKIYLILQPSFPLIDNYLSFTMFLIQFILITPSLSEYKLKKIESVILTR